MLKALRVRRSLYQSDTLSTYVSMIFNTFGGLNLTYYKEPMRFNEFNYQLCDFYDCTKYLEFDLEMDITNWSDNNYS